MCIRDSLYRDPVDIPDNQFNDNTDENTVTQQYSTISYTLAHLPGTKFVCEIDGKSLTVTPQTSYKTNPRTDPLR